MTNDTKRVSFTFTTALYDELLNVAGNTGNASAIVREAVAKEIKRRGGSIAKDDIHPPRRGGAREGAGRPAGED